MPFEVLQSEWILYYYFNQKQKSFRRYDKNHFVDMTKKNNKIFLFFDHFVK